MCEYRLSVSIHPHRRNRPCPPVTLRHNLLYDLIASIQKVLSEVVEDHRNHLAENELPLLEMDLIAFQQLAHYQECVAAIESVNQIIQNNLFLYICTRSEKHTYIIK